MKILHTLWIVLALWLPVLTSCTQDPAIDPSEGQDVKIVFKTGTRADGTNIGSEEDRYINTLRVMGYWDKDGTLAFNRLVHGPSSENKQQIPDTEIQVKTGKYTIIFIANEHADELTSDLLKDITSSQNNTLSYLRKEVAFARSAFSGAKDIPMVTIKENIVIQGDRLLIDPSLITGENPTGLIADVWSVSMVRLGVRIDLALTASSGSFGNWWNAGSGKLYFNNVPSKVYIYPKTDNSVGMATNNEVYSVAPGYPGTMPGEVSGNRTVKFERIILPESYFTPVTNSDKALEVSLSTTGSNAYKAIVRFDKSKEDYTLRRNTFLDITATLTNEVEPELELEIGPGGENNDWNDENIGHDL